MNETPTRRPRRRDQRGNGCAGCLGLLALVLVLSVLVFACSGADPDCYLTPGAQPGSAQHDRDVQRCL